MLWLIYFTEIILPFTFNGFFNERVLWKSKVSVCMSVTYSSVWTESCLVYFWSYVCNFPSNLYFQIIRDTEFLSFYFNRKSKDNLNLLYFSDSCQTWGCLKTQVCRTKCMSLWCYPAVVEPNSIRWIDCFILLALKTPCVSGKTHVYCWFSNCTLCRT